MDFPNHATEVSHAQIQSTRLSEHAVIEGLLVLLCVIGCVTNRVSILLLGVAAPHHINWSLASQEVICVLKQHTCVASLNTHLVVLALAVSVTEETNLSRIWDNSNDIHANLVLRFSLWFEIQLIESLHIVVESAWLICGAAIADSEINFF